MGSGDKIMKNAVFALTLIVPSISVSEISYQEILKDPDNIQLNRQYATERLQRGKPKAALGAIERVLVKQPTNLPARLMRARILMAMGSDPQARGELHALNVLPLPDNIAREVAAMLSTLTRRRARWNFLMSFSFGYLDGENVNSFPESGQAELPQGTSNFISSNGTSEFDLPVDDKALTSGIGLYSEYDLLNQNADKLFTSLNASKVSDSDTQFMEYTSYDLTIGAKLNPLGLEIIPKLTYGEIDSKTQPKTIYESVGLDINKRFFAQSFIFMSFSANKRDYQKSTLYQSADNSDSETVAARGGVSFALTKHWRTTIFASWQDVEATLLSAQYNSKESKYGAISLQGMITRGQTISLGYRVGESDHRAEDSGAQRIRRDDITAYNVNYQLMGSLIHRGLKNFRLIAGYSQIKTNSNILQFNNDKKTKSLLLNYTNPF